MREIIRVSVRGAQPVPQGSLSAGRNGHLYYSNAETLKPWRNRITTCVKDVLPSDYVALDAPVKVTATFYFPPLKSPKPFKTSAPDLDKLLRAVLDALTASGIYSDDSRVVWVDSRKKYANNADGMGVDIVVHEVLDLG